MAVNKKLKARRSRQARIRKNLSGTSQRPRLSVFRSIDNIYAQVIDDESGTTLASASSVDKKLKSLVDGKTKIEQAQVVGQHLAERALDAGVKKVVFDRGGFRYNGRIKALADASREAGLDF